jgi:hypothetical protein
MSTKSERMQVLEMIENGLITPAEGAGLLDALGEAEGVDQNSSVELDETNIDIIETSVVVENKDQAFTQAKSANQFPPENEIPPSQTTTSPSGTFDPKLAHWRRYWMIPLWIGVGITILGGLLLFLAYQAGGFSFWFGCAWLPFLLGLGVMVMAVASRSARWLHLRVQQKPGERPQTISLSFPLPLHLAAWFIRNFGHHIPQLKNTGVDEMILALGKQTSPNAPFYVEVNEGEDGEKVQVYIG